jgi:hypothetical protein
MMPPSSRDRDGLIEHALEISPAAYFGIRGSSIVNLQCSCTQEAKLAKLLRCCVRQ